MRRYRLGNIRLALAFVRVEEVLANLGVSSLLEQISSFGRNAIVAIEEQNLNVALAHRKRERGPPHTCALQMR